MVETRKTQVSKKKPVKKTDESGSAPTSQASEQKRKLKELDEFIEGVLQEAGEEFLDEFKQIEGE